MTSRKGWRTRALLQVESLESRALLASVAGSHLVDDSIPASANGPTSSLTSLFVQFDSAATDRDADAAIRSVGGTTTETYPDGTHLVQLASSASVGPAIQQLSKNPEVIYVQANTVVQAAAAVYPNDPVFPYSWGLNNINNVDVDAPEAWAVTTGNPYTIVAVLDTGIDLGDPDLASRIWTNPSNDAAAGFPNDIHGWNFVSNTNNVQDNNGHGTFVSSIIGAAGNNGYGIAGLAWNVQIMPVKFLDANGVGTTDRAVSAIYYAVNHGARVINASWGGIDFTQPLADAVAYANAHNVVFVTAAGNEGADNNVVPSYPSSLRLPNELSVTAIDSNGQLPSFANYGSQTVDIAAPGVSIVGEYPTSLSASGLQVLSGTSMSTAYVSGVVALLVGLHPELTASQVVQQIDATAKPLPSLTGKIISGGMVDASRALGSSTSDVLASIFGSSEFSANQGGTDQAYVTALYQDILDRNPDPAGLAYWSNLITTGVATRPAVASALLDSGEGRATEVAEWYQTDLGRTTAIDDLKNDGGVQSWVQLFNAGFTAETVEALILASPEYLQAHGGTPQGVVNGWYQNVLGRDADASGSAGWVNLLATGATPLTVLQAIQNTTEAKTTRVARWFSRYLGRPGTLAVLKNDAGVDSLAANLLSS